MVFIFTHVMSCVTHTVSLGHLCYSLSSMNQCMMTVNTPCKKVISLWVTIDSIMPALCTYDNVMTIKEHKTVYIYFGC